MLDNPLNQTQDPINTDQADTLGTADGIVTETQKPCSLPTLERPLLTVIGFFAYFWAFHFGKSLVEWQFGLTISLSAVLAITLPALLRENKRATSELSEKRLCPCFFCSIFEPLMWIGIAHIPIFIVWIGGKTTYKLIAVLIAFVIIFVPILYLENERLSSRLTEEGTEPRNFRHALAFVALAIIVGSIGWIVGTGTRTFVEVAVPKLTLL